MTAIAEKLPLSASQPARFVVSFLLAAIITFGLYWLMNTLITTGRTALDEGAKGRIIDFVRLKKDQSLDTKDRKPKRPPKPETPPPQIQPRQQQTMSPSADAISIAPMSPDDISLRGFGLSASDGEYLPIVKVEPMYPRRAASRGIEGYVLLEFTVTAAGAVRDPVVIESEPSGYFERVAMKAALKFKYKPRVIDGVPIEVHGVQNLIKFELVD